MISQNGRNSKKTFSIKKMMILKKNYQKMKSLEELSY